MVIDQTITYPVGRVEITLQYVRDGAYTVTTIQGGTLRIEDNCGSYATEAEARAVARLYAETYKAEHIAELTRDLHTAQRRRDYKRADEINDLLDQLDSPAQVEADRQALADIADNIRQAPRNFRELRDGYANDAARDRTARKAVAR